MEDKPAFQCNDADLDWWQKTIIYQIYPRSFQDSNGDGVGDIPGIISRLDHFSYLNIETIWLSPIYPSPMKDHGYDISDFENIEPLFGTLDDFDRLVSELHKRGMKLILDFIPNHSSDLHTWFIESKKGGPGNPYKDYYIWHDGKIDDQGKRVPPNNWLGTFGGSAWTWVESRKQFYFHQYLPEQPDLNWRNPAIKSEMQAVFKFWLDRGVDGFRIDTIGTLYEVEDVLQDEPRSYVEGVPPNDWFYLDHIYTKHQPENYRAVAEWRQFFDEYEQNTGRHHIYMVVELYDKTMQYSMPYYTYGSDGPFNFNLTYLNQDSGGQGVFQLVDSWLKNMPVGKWPNWVLGNHDRRRISSLVGEAYTDVLNILLLLLPGTPTVYEGDEIGMLNVDVTWEETQDPWGLFFGKDKYKTYSRDPSRAPMQWTDGKNAGFSDGGSTWLPVHPDFITRNVQRQKANPTSSINIFKKASSLRNVPCFQIGHMEYSLITKDIFSFVRRISEERYLVILNFGKDSATCNFSDFVGSKPNVVLATANVDVSVKEGCENIEMKPGDGVVIHSQ